MNVVHHCEIFAQQLVQGQHYVAFLEDKPNVVYIGVCDWGEVAHLQEVMP